MYLDGWSFLFTSGETPLALINFFLVSATLLVDLMEREGVVVTHCVVVHVWGGSCTRTCYVLRNSNTANKHYK